MNFLTSFLIAIFCVSSEFIETTYSLPTSNILRRKIEKFRQQMPCGINGGPGLVPFRQEFVDINYNSSMISAKGFLQNLQVDHLNEFVVDSINFSLLRLKLDFSVRLPKMVTSGHYNVSGEYLNKIKLWGSGPFTVTFHDLKVSGYLRLRIANGFLDMTELKPTLSLISLESNISGILGSEQTTVFFNKLIEDLIPQMLVTYSNDIGQMISQYMTPIANKYLHELTLSDIIGGGSGNENLDENDKPCVVKFIAFN